MKLSSIFTQIFFLSLFLGIFSTKLRAHGDEIPTDPGVAKDHFTAYGQSEKYELTLYFSEMEAGKATLLTLFIADFQGNRPIEKAELKIGTLEDPSLSFTAKAVSPGVYELSGMFTEAKIYTLNVQISHPNGADLTAIAGVEVGKKLATVAALTAPLAEQTNPWLMFLGGLLLGGLVVWFVSRRKNRSLTAVFLLASAFFSSGDVNPIFAHGDEEHGPKMGGSGGGKTVFAPKETQFLFEILTQPIAIGDYQSTTTMFGTVVPASGGLGAVVVPQSGRVVRMQVAVGQTVRAGQVLAILQQSIGTPDEVNIAASNSGLAVQIEAAKAQVAATKRELERLKKIEDIAAGRDVQAAEANFNRAIAELKTLESKSIGSNTLANNRSISLVAPIGGVVSAFTLTPGAEVVAGQTLFTITNLGKVFVEAQVYDHDVPMIQAGNKFLVTCANDDHKTAEVRLVSQAQSINPSNQSQRVLFEMENPHGDFKIGEFVTLKALNQQSSNRQITVPNGALTEINGRTAVFLKHAPEIFELAFVQTGADDGTRTLILKGIEESERVVSKGAYEVKMMYLNQ